MLPAVLAVSIVVETNYFCPIAFARNDLRPAVVAIGTFVDVVDGIAQINKNKMCFGNFEQIEKGAEWCCRNAELVVWKISGDVEYRSLTGFSSNPFHHLLKIGIIVVQSGYHQVGYFEVLA